MFHCRTWDFSNSGIILTLTLISLSQSLPVEENGNIPLIARPENCLASRLDESVNPCTDFYAFTCGNWAERNVPKVAVSEWSDMHAILHDISTKIQALLNAMDSATDNEAIQKARKVYRACMSEDAMEGTGADPLKSIIHESGGWPLIMEPLEWKSKKIIWQRVHSKLIKTSGTMALFDLTITTDYKNSSINRIIISVPSLFLKRRELVNPGKSLLAAAYNRYKFQVSKVIKRAITGCEGGISNVSMLKLSDFESKLAEIIPERENIEDIDQLYSLMSINELQNFYDCAEVESPTAEINWLETIRNVLTLAPEITVDGSEQIIVWAKSYFTKLAALLSKTSQETIVNYIMWKTIAELTTYANDELMDFWEEFDGERIEADGVCSRLEIYCELLSPVTHATAHKFVKNYFPSQWKQETMELVENIQEGMKQSIRQSLWLDDETKNLAIEKIDAITKLIGYPDVSNDTDIDNYYSEFTPTDSFFENQMRWRIFEMKSKLRKLRQQPDRHEWLLIEPFMVNAFYIRQRNSVVIPAGILQPPFFDFKRPSVINYGMIGTIIGHEISHALDNESRHYDKNGNIVTWWSQLMIDLYKERAQCFVDQFSNYMICEDGMLKIPVNGSLTLAENIADTEGLQVTWNAYKKFRDENDCTSDMKIPGLEKFTDDQLFFIAFGFTRCSYRCEKDLQEKSPHEYHSPDNIRINGPASNIEAFATAFNCPPNSPMNPPKKCRIFN